MTFSNPVPVAVALVPFEGKLIGIRRGIEPRKGLAALPGGYINSGETFCAALSREVLEETGAQINEGSWKVFHVGDSVPSNRILIFGITTEAPFVDLKFSGSETLEIVLIDSTTPLAFPLHEEVRNQYFRKS